jgi:hypothetical protein
MQRSNCSTKVPIIAAAALALSACAGGLPAVTPVSNVYYDNSFTGSEIGFMEKYNPIPVVVRGAPPGSERAVVDIMNQNHATGNLVFAPAPAPSDGYSIVMAFGGGASCQPRGGDAGGAPPGPLSAVFCTGPRVRSSAISTVAAADPNSPQFRVAVDSMTTTLFSPDLDYTRRRRASGE